MLDSPIKNLLIPVETIREDEFAPTSGAMVGNSLSSIASTHSNNSNNAKVPKLEILSSDSSSNSSVNSKKSFDFVFSGLSDSSGFQDYKDFQTSKSKAQATPNLEPKPEINNFETFVNQKNISNQNSKNNTENSSQSPANTTAINLSRTPKTFESDQNITQTTKINFNKDSEKKSKSNFDQNKESVIPPLTLLGEVKQNYHDNQNEIKTGRQSDIENLITKPIIQLWEDFIFEIKDYNSWLSEIITKPRVVTLLLILLFAFPFIYYPTKANSSRRADLPKNQTPQFSGFESPDLGFKLDSPFNFGKNFGDSISRNLPAFDSNEVLATIPPKIKINIDENANGQIIDNLNPSFENIQNTLGSESTLLANKNKSGIVQPLTTIEGNIVFSDSQKNMFESSSLPPNTSVIIDYNGVRSNAIVSPPSSPLPSDIIGIANLTVKEKLSTSSNQQQTLGGLSKIKVKIIPE